MQRLHKGRLPTKSPRAITAFIKRPETDPKPPVISVGFAVPQQVIGSIRLETPNRYLARKPNFVEYSA
jgi:hypothetical protein